MIVKRCKGCGALLQTENENKPGFVPQMSEEISLCKRCFRIMHYNELPKIVATNQEYEFVIDSVVKRKALMVFIVDIFAFKSTFLDAMIERLRDKDVLLLVNKIDLLPKSTNFDRVIEWVSRECQKKHFKVLGIGLASAKKKLYIKDLLEMLDQARAERDVYFIGCANVGKSSIINALLKQSLDSQNDVIATSMIPGTTLNEIRIPFFIDNRALVDTPGLINEKDILSKLFPVSYSKILPKNELKPITFQITNQNSIFIGGLAVFSFESQQMVPVTVYTAPTLYLHRCKTEKVEDLMKNQLGILLNPPVEEERKNLHYTTKKFIIHGKKDIWLAGFGFVQIHRSCTVTLKYIENTEVYVTDALIGVC